MRSALAASAASISASSRTSTSIGRSGRAARAASTAAPTPPASAMWFSLMRIASKRPARWLVPPPSTTAAFSRPRRPGVVLRVSRTVAPPPASTADDLGRHRRDARQPLQEVQRGALGGEQRARRALDAHRDRARLFQTPSVPRSISQSGSSRRKTASATSSPQITPGLLLDDRRDCARASAGDRRLRRHVPRADVLRQGASTRRSRSSKRIAEVLATANVGEPTSRCGLGDVRLFAPRRCSKVGSVAPCRRAPAATSERR